MTFYESVPCFDSLYTSWPSEFQHSVQHHRNQEEEKILSRGFPVQRRALVQVVGLKNHQTWDSWADCFLDDPDVCARQHVAGREGTGAAGIWCSRLVRNYSTRPRPIPVLQLICLKRLLVVAASCSVESLGGVEAKLLDRIVPSFKSRTRCQKIWADHDSPLLLPTCCRVWDQQEKKIRTDR